MFPVINLMMRQASRAFVGAQPAGGVINRRAKRGDEGLYTGLSRSDAARGRAEKRERDGAKKRGGDEGLYTGLSRSDAARGRAEKRERAGAKERGGDEGLYTGLSRSDAARGRAEKRARAGAKERGGDEGLYTGLSRSDAARGRAEKRAARDKAKQAQRRADPQDEEEHLYQGRSRADKARDRAAQRTQDSETARDLGVTQKQVREEREWQAERTQVVQQAAAETVQANASMSAMPGGEVMLAAMAVQAARRADAGFQARSLRPIVRDRAPAAAQAKLTDAFTKLEAALAA